MDRNCSFLLSGVTVCLIALAIGAGPAAAQQTYEPPAHVAFVDGVAAHEREGTSRAPTPGVPFLTGDRLRSAEGRLEVLFPDGSALHLDEFTEVELLAPSLLRLNAGRILLLIVGSENPRNAMTIQVDTAVGSATADGPGEYRVAIRPSVVGQELEFSVYRGWGLIATEQGATELAAGERSIAYEGSRPAGPSRFNAARFDAFDRWSQVRRDSRMVDVVSGEYLPENLRSYGAVFNSYGTWEYEQDYGQVWYPRVDVGWRPYYNGYWSSYPAYGWTWIGHDPWGWPTHHYGRWGHAHSRWFWIPDPYWGPGWVSWAYAPGYTAWSPLGYGGAPVFGLSVGFGWGSGWVVTTGAYFTAGVYHTPVHHYAVAPHHLPPPAHFVPKSAPPPIAAPRPIPPAGMQVANSSYVGAPRAGATSRPAATLNQTVTTRGQGPAAGSGFAASRTGPRAGTQSATGGPVTLGRSRAEAATSQTGSVDTTRTASPTRRLWSSDPASANGAASSSTPSRTAQQVPRFSREAPARSASAEASEAPSAPVTRGRAASLSAPSQRAASGGARTHSGLSPTSRIQRSPAPAPAEAQPAPPAPSARSAPSGTMRALTPSSSSPNSSAPPAAAAPRFGGSARPSAAPATRSSAGAAPSAPSMSAPRSAPRSSGSSNASAGAPRASSAPAARSSSAPAARSSSAPAARSPSGSGSSSTGSSSGSGSSSGGRFGARR